jgi:hypothetical protein
MLDLAESKPDRYLTPDEILGIVKWRYRICNYLFNAGAIWMAAGISVLLMMVLFNVRLNGLFWFAEATGCAVFTVAFTLTLAIYRCPVCDTYLSRFRPDKLRCPNCNAQVKEAQ